MSQGQRANRIGCAEFRRNLAMDRRGRRLLRQQGAPAQGLPSHPQDALDPKINYTDYAGRPHPVLPFGEPIEELF